MASYKRRRSALLNVIQGLEDSDVVSDDIVELDQVEENVPEQVEEPSVETADDFELPEDNDDETIVSDEELENILNSLDDGDEVCEGCEDKEVVASETAPGVEDIITDTENGGQPTTSEVAPGGDVAKTNVEETKDVFPTESEYVARLTNKFDKIASELEKMGMKKLAFRLDVLSDKLESSIKK